MNFIVPILHCILLLMIWKERTRLSKNVYLQLLSKCAYDSNNSSDNEHQNNQQFHQQQQFNSDPYNFQHQQNQPLHPQHHQMFSNTQELPYAPVNSNSGDQNEMYQPLVDQREGEK